MIVGVMVGKKLSRKQCGLQQWIFYPIVLIDLQLNVKVKLKVKMKNTAYFFSSIHLLGMELYVDTINTL